MKNQLKLIALEEVEGKKQWQRKKIPMVAVFSNMLLPGLGEVYNGRRIKAAIMAGLSSIYMGKAWLHYKRSVMSKKARDRYSPDSFHWYFHDEWYVYHRESARDFLWWSAAIWIIGMLDAYVDAHLYDIRAYKPEVSNGGTKYLTVGVGF